LKKIIVFFLIISSILSFTSVYIQTNEDEFSRIEHLEQTISKEFIIPDNSLLANPDEIYPLLLDAATVSHVNIFRPSVNYKQNDEVEIVKYVLLTVDTKLYDTLQIQNGRALTFKDIRSKENFISSVKSKDVNQIGTIKDFGDNDLITVKFLQTSYNYLPVEGTYYVETMDNKVYHDFLSTFTDNLNQYYKKYGSNISFTSDDFVEASTELDYNSKSSSSRSYLMYIEYVIFIVILLLLIYTIFNESKKIGILKLHGVTNVRLWFTIIGKLITIACILSVSLSLGISNLIPNSNQTFIARSLFYQLANYVIVFGVSLIPYIYISKVKVHQIIKNRKDTTSIFILNTLVKVVCSIVIILLGISYFNQYLSISKQQEDLRGWERNKDYGIFYPVYIGYDLNDVRQGSYGFDAIVGSKLYPLLDKMGSILINARQYEETALLLDKDYQGIRSVTVNNNYLGEFPIYDTNRNPIQVSDENENWVLLVPQKYKNREEQILLFFKESRKSFMDYELENLKLEVPSRLKNQKIKIIWILDNQKIFSFNPEVFKAEKNIIIDPIIQVVTESNSFAADRNSILGNGGTDPLKIKLMNRDTALTYKTLAPELKKLQLDDNLKYIVTVDEYMMKEIYNLQKQMNLILWIIIGLFIGLCILIVQNSIVFFIKYQQKFIVRRLFGIGFLGTYKEYGILFAVNWTIQFLVVFIVNRTVDIGFLSVSTFLIGIELVTTMVSLLFIENKNRVKVLKGG
jgi:bacteriocin-associated integral membrane protein